MSKIRRLGIDLGTNSLGWALLEIDKEQEAKGEGEYATIIDAGVRIFSNGRNPKNGESLAVERRSARGARRTIARRKQRWAKLASLLKQYNLLPTDINLSNDPYELRHLATKQKLEPYDLGRAIYHLGKRRGFKSNRLTDGDDKELSDYKQGMENLRLKLKEKEATIGSHLHELSISKQIIRFKASNTDRPLRTMYEDEFEKIKEVQFKFHPQIDWKILHDTIFYQRPLKAGIRGKCSVPNCDCERAYSASPAFQGFRLWQDVMNLVPSDSNNQKMMWTMEQRFHIVDKYSKQKSISFDKLKKDKVLYVDGVAPNTFNLEKGKKGEGLKGITTDYDFLNLLGEEMWTKICLDDNDERLVDTIIQSTTDEPVIALMKELKLDESLFEKINKWKPDSKKITSMCAKHYIEACTIIQEKAIRADEALSMLGLNNQDRASECEKYSKLPYYGEVLNDLLIGGDSNANPVDEVQKYWGRIGNPTVHIALNQLQKVINAFTDKYGKPDEIALELGRDLKISEQKRRDIESENNKNYKENDKLANKLKAEFHLTRIGALDIKKARFYEKQAGVCIYCGKHFHFSDLEIEHILPYSLTLNNKESNMLLSCTKCNRIKANKAPYVAFAHHSDYNWAEIIRRVNDFDKNKLKFFKEESLKDYTDDKSFIDSQLSDNQYIARSALRYLKSYIQQDKIWSVNGKTTEMIRNHWGWNWLLTDKEKFNSMPKETRGKAKNRSDHRHHALDAIAIALTSRSLIQNIASVNAKLGENDELLVKNTKVPPCPLVEYKIEDKLASILPSIKTDHGLNGQLFKDTAYGRQQNLYNNITISDFKEEDILANPNYQDQFSSLWNECFNKECAKFNSEQLKKDKLCISQELWSIEKIGQWPSYKHKAYSLKNSAFNSAKKLFFKDKAPTLSIYKKEFVYSIPLTSLENEKHLKDIISPKIRQELQNLTTGITDKKDFQTKLEEYTKATGTRSVRYLGNQNGNTVVQNIKAYAADGYACVEIWRTPQGKKADGESFYKYEGVFINRSDALVKAAKAKNDHIYFSDRPHPAAKRIMQLFKQDIIACYLSDEKVEELISNVPPERKKEAREESKRPIYARIVGIAQSLNRVQFVPIYATSSDTQEWKEKTKYSHRKYGHKFWQTFKFDIWTTGIDSTFNIFYKIEKVILDPLGKPIKYKN